MKFATERKFLLHLVYYFCVLASAVSMAASVVTFGPVLFSKFATLKDGAYSVATMFVVTSALVGIALASRPCSTPKKAADTDQSKFAEHIGRLLLVVGIGGLLILGVICIFGNLHRLPLDGLY